MVGPTEPPEGAVDGPEEVLAPSIISWSVGPPKSAISAKGKFKVSVQPFAKFKETLLHFSIKINLFHATSISLVRSVHSLLL
jgi:hypothetical protein